MDFIHPANRLDQVIEMAFELVGWTCRLRKEVNNTYRLERMVEILLTSGRYPAPLCANQLSGMGNNLGMHSFQRRPSAGRAHAH